MSLPSLVQRLKFVEKLPYIPVSDIDPENRECIVCLEAYDEDTPWQQGETVNRPVKLSNCRHIFGLQCLARFMFSPNFDGCCPICRTEIVSALPNSSYSHTDALSTLVNFIGLIQSELTVGKAALWKIVKAHTIWERRREGRDEYMERIEMLLDEYANALCGGSEEHTDPGNAMDTREERHRTQIQAWANSQWLWEQHYEETIKEFAEKANEIIWLADHFNPLVSISAVLLPFHSFASSRPHLLELMLDVMLVAILASWATATGIFVYAYRRGNVGGMEQSLLYGMPIIGGFLIYYAAMLW